MEDEGSEEGGEGGKEIAKVARRLHEGGAKATPNATQGVKGGGVSKRKSVAAGAGAGEDGEAWEEGEKGERSSSGEEVEDEWKPDKNEDDEDDEDDDGEDEEYDEDDEEVRRGGRKARSSKPKSGAKAKPEGGRHNSVGRGSGSGGSDGAGTPRMGARARARAEARKTLQREKEQKERKRQDRGSGEGSGEGEAQFGSPITSGSDGEAAARFGSGGSGSDGDGKRGKRGRGQRRKRTARVPAATASEEEALVSSDEGGSAPDDDPNSCCVPWCRPKCPKCMAGNKDKFDEITQEPLEELHVCWRSPDGSTRMCLNLSTLEKVKATVGKGQWLLPPHFREKMTESDPLWLQIQQRFGSMSVKYSETGSTGEWAPSARIGSDLYKH